MTKKERDWMQQQHHRPESAAVIRELCDQIDQLEAERSAAHAEIERLGAEMRSAFRYVYRGDMEPRKMEEDVP